MGERQCGWSPSEQKHFLANRSRRSSWDECNSEEIEALYQIDRMGTKLAQLKRMAHESRKYDSLHVPQQLRTDIAKLRNCLDLWSKWYVEANHVRIES